MSVPYFISKEIAEKTWMIEYGFQPGPSTMYAYLIEGSESSLLIDTIMGWGDLKGYCETLTSKPIKLVNTHCHPDHIGGNFQFDVCWMHPADISDFNSMEYKTHEQVYESMKAAAADEYKDQVTMDDCRAQVPMRVLPIYDGDVFDLGDRQIEVVEAVGHTAGSVVLIDPKTRLCFSGDACNSNTLMFFPNSLSVEAYLESLLYLKKLAPEFDMLYGGHEVLPPSVIDEGIETCARVIAGTDDKEPGFAFGRNVIYAAAHDETGRGRADGKTFNMMYDPAKIMDVEDPRQIIK